jgi:ABC-type molybdenum transport system ATPase subunit/photorepair protein PhrA
MRAAIPLLKSFRLGSSKTPPPQLINIRDATFYREHPARFTERAANPPLFPGLTFCLDARDTLKNGEQHTENHWAVIAGEDGTSFLDVLRGSYICDPPNARTYPYLSSDELASQQPRYRVPSRAIQYVGFNSAQRSGLDQSLRGAYLSARYESHREETDWTVFQYLSGNTELNPTEKADTVLLRRDSPVIENLRLSGLLDMPVSNLSNGQTRRSRIAKAMLNEPKLLLLDEPFMGLDPPTVVKLSQVLRDLAYRSSPMLILALRPQDPIPDWITHLAILGKGHTVALMGEKRAVLFSQHRWLDLHRRNLQGGFSQRTAASGAMKIAQDMSRAYGPPHEAIGDDLTASGIQAYCDYHDFMSKDRTLRSASHFDQQGMVRSSSTVTEILQTPFEAAEEKESSTLNEQWLLASASPLQGGRQLVRTGDVGPVGHDAQGQVVKGQIRVPDEEADAEELSAKDDTSRGSSLVELKSVVVKYGNKIVLGREAASQGTDAHGLDLSIYQGTRLAVLGPNGSGKTTLLSLITSDHPQSYSLPIKFFGRSRLPEPGKPGLSLWEIQSRIGHSAPEVHAFFPKQLTVRQVLESAWAETFISRPLLDSKKDDLVDAFLRWWEPELRQDQPTLASQGEDSVFDLPENRDPLAKQYRRSAHQYHGFTRPETRSEVRRILHDCYPPLITPFTWWGMPKSNLRKNLEVLGGVDWADDAEKHRFGVLPFATQRLLLFLRAIIKLPDIVILDEAFSGMSNQVREKAMCFLEHGETMFLRNQPDVQVPIIPKSHVSSGDQSNLRHNYRADIRRLVSSDNLDLSKIMHDRFDGLTSKRRSENDKYAMLIAGSIQELHQRLEGARVSNEDKIFDPEVRDYCFTGLKQDQALVVVSHVKEEIPAVCNEWLRLPNEEEISEEGKGVMRGRTGRDGISKLWDRIWMGA